MCALSLKSIFSFTLELYSHMFKNVDRQTKKQSFAKIHWEPYWSVRGCLAFDKNSAKKKLSSKSKDLCDLQPHVKPCLSGVKQGAKQILSQFWARNLGALLSATQIWLRICLALSKVQRGVLSKFLAKLAQNCQKSSKLLSIKQILLKMAHNCLKTTFSLKNV